MQDAWNRNKNWVVVFVLFCAWIVGYFDKNAINVASITISKEFGLKPNQIGLIMSSFFLSYAFMTLMGGFLADKFGSRKVVTTIMVLWSIFTCLTGVAWSFTSLVVIRFLFGAAEGGFPSATSVTVADLFPKEKRGRAKSFIVSAGSFGSAFGPLIVASLTVTLGWRSAFWFFGIAGMIISVLFFVIFKKMHKSEVSSGIVEVKKQKVPLREVLKVSFVWKLMIMQFALGVFMWGLNSWMPSYWVKVRHLDMITMGKLSAIPWIIAFFLMNFGGYLLDKYLAGREKYFLAALFAISAVFTYLMYTAQSVPLAFTYLTVTTVATSMASPAVFVLPLKYMRTELIGTATGVANFGQQTAGILAPTIMGYMITLFNGSYDAVFGFVIATIAVATVIAATLDTKKYLTASTNESATSISTK